MDLTLGIPSYLSDYLRSVCAHDVPHSGRNLMVHLEGTWNILQKFGCRYEVCVAGLFHSVYGTHTFAPECVSLRDRESVIFVIGAEAEFLVYLFAISSRPDTFLDAMNTGFLREHLTGKKIPVTREILRDLIEIECANLIEQGIGRKFLSRFVEILDEKRFEGFGSVMLSHVDKYIEIR